VRFAHGCFLLARRALPASLVLGLRFAFPSLVRRLERLQTSGDLGEHCSSSAAGHGVCAPLGRVAQPRLFADFRGNPRRGRQTRGAFFLVTFSLAKQEKVTSCRATPDGFILNVSQRVKGQRPIGPFHRLLPWIYPRFSTIMRPCLRAC
jgi:hypothetical protein